MPMLGMVNLVEHEGAPGHGQAISTEQGTGGTSTLRFAAISTPLRLNPFKTQDLAFNVRGPFLLTSNPK